MVSSDIRHAAASCSSFPAAREDARPSRPQDESRGAGRDPDGHEEHLDRHQHPLGYVPTLPLSPLHLTTDFGAGSEQKGAPELGGYWERRLPCLLLSHTTSLSPSTSQNVAPGALAVGLWRRKRRADTAGGSGPYNWE